VANRWGFIILAQILLNMKRITATLLFTAIFFYTGMACTNLLITSGASVNGSNMVSYSADSHTRYGVLVHYPAAKFPKGSMLNIYEWGKERYLGQIPQVTETYNVIGNMNEHQVIIGESTWGGVESLYDAQGVVDYGSLMYIALQRAKNCKRGHRSNYNPGK